MQRMTRDIRGNIGFRIAMGFVLLAVCMLPLKARAEEIDFATRIAQLQAKFPQEKYWNHVGMAADNSDGYTDNPCTEHKTAGVYHIYGTGGCTCNHFAGGGHLLATQCMGFANKLGYEVFGDTTWTTYNNPDPAAIRVGDIVRIGGSHSVFVIARTGNNIMVGEANYPDCCQISWNRIINLAQVTVTYYEHAKNYDTVIGSSPAVPGTTEEPATEISTTEQAVVEQVGSFTGWKKTADNKHYQYYKKGKLQKKKWLTIKKKKYYVDKKGYRLTGLHKVGAQTYYFNSKGVMQKKKWVTVDGDTYYVDSLGRVLKKQWLYYKNTKVYVTGNGSIAKNELVKIGGKTYYFNSKGKRSKGFKKVKGKYYYCDRSGIIQKKKWITKGGKKYYLQKSGVRAQSKLIKIGKYRYYFNSKGQMQKNKKFTYQNKNYKADKKGHCKFLSNVKVTEETTEKLAEEKTEETTGGTTEEKTEESATIVDK